MMKELVSFKHHPGIVLLVAWPTSPIIPFPLLLLHKLTVLSLGMYGQEQWSDHPWGLSSYKIAGTARYFQIQHGSTPPLSFVLSWISIWGGLDVPSFSGSSSLDLPCVYPIMGGCSGGPCHQSTVLASQLQLPSWSYRLCRTPDCSWFPLSSLPRLCASLRAPDPAFSPVPFHLLGDFPWCPSCFTVVAHIYCKQISSPEIDHAVFLKYVYGS